LKFAVSVENFLPRLLFTRESLHSYSAY